VLELTVYHFKKKSAGTFLGEIITTSLESLKMELGTNHRYQAFSQYDKSITNCY
jgi:hypothetical protein